MTTQAELRPVFFACGHPYYTGSWWCRTCGSGECVRATAEAAGHNG